MIASIVVFQHLDSFCSWLEVRAALILFAHFYVLVGYQFCLYLIQAKNFSTAWFAHVYVQALPFFEANIFVYPVISIQLAILLINGINLYLHIFIYFLFLSRIIFENMLHQKMSLLCLQPIQNKMIFKKNQIILPFLCL